jgi:hypothetical protein
LEVTLKSFVGEKTAFDQEKSNFYGNREEVDKQISAHKESLRLLEIERQGFEEERLREQKNLSQLKVERLEFDQSEKIFNIERVAFGLRLKTFETDQGAFAKAKADFQVKIQDFLRKKKEIQ